MVRKAMRLVDTSFGNEANCLPSIARYDGGTAFLLNKRSHVGQTPN